MKEETNRSGVNVAFCRLPSGAGLPLPAAASAGAACVDLHAAIPQEAPLSLAPARHAAVPCGIAIALPEGWEAQIRPRSGLARDFGVTILNAPGTIDSDYRGEIAAILINHGTKDFVITRGMRVAQLALAPVAAVHWQDCRALPESTRGANGFGSTGLGREIGGRTA